MQHNKKKTLLLVSSLCDSVKLHSVFQRETSVPSTHHNKALDKRKDIRHSKISQKAWTNQSQKNPYHGNGVCMCMCVSRFLSGIKLTPLHKANFAVAFQQAIFQRLISYCNRHQSTTTEKQMTKTNKRPIAAVKIHWITRLRHSLSDFKL